MTFDGSAKPALVITALTLAVCGIGFRFAARAAEAYFAKNPVELRSPLTNIPKKLGPWRSEGPDARQTAEVEESLGTTLYLDRSYVRGEGRDAIAIHVHIPYYTGLIDAVPHVPDRCFVAAGLVKQALPANLQLPLDRSAWQPDLERVNLSSGEPYPLLTFPHHVTGQLNTVRMPVGDGFKIRTTEFRDPSHPNHRIYSGYFFIANGRVAHTPEDVRKLAFDLTSRHAYYAKIQFTMYTTRQMETDDFTEAVADFAGELLPELMLCLPDWSEIESGAAGSL